MDPSKERQGTSMNGIKRVKIGVPKYKSGGLWMLQRTTWTAKTGVVIVPGGERGTERMQVIPHRTGEEASMSTRGGGRRTRKAV